jgi:murein DD-endopeptidase MepM/ murein hydrolase activator NlpD
MYWLIFAIGFLSVFMGETKLVPPISGKITSRFGKRGNAYHNGIDIGAPIGTPIHAPLKGSVYLIFNNSFGGLQLIIQHPENFFTGYAHLSQVNVSKGQIISQSQIIAHTGNSGESTGPHLHFVCRKNGKLIDPSLIFKFN